MTNYDPNLLARFRPRPTLAHSRPVSPSSPLNHEAGGTGRLAPSPFPSEAAELSALPLHLAAVLTVMLPAPLPRHCAVATSADIQDAQKPLADFRTASRHFLGALLLPLAERLQTNHTIYDKLHDIDGLLASIQDALATAEARAELRGHP